MPAVLTLGGGISWSVLFLDARGPALHIWNVSFALRDMCDLVLQPLSLFPPLATGVTLCLERALAKSGVRAEEVTYVNAHGTSTQVICSPTPQMLVPTSHIFLFLVSCHPMVLLFPYNFAQFGPISAGG